MKTIRLLIALTLVLSLALLANRADGAVSHQDGNRGLYATPFAPVVEANRSAPTSGTLTTRPDDSIDILYITQVARMIAPDGVVRDVCRHAVAISGDTIVAGAPFDYDQGNASSSAYVYRLTARMRHYVYPSLALKLNPLFHSQQLGRTGTACVFEVPLGAGSSLSFEVT